MACAGRVPSICRWKLIDLWSEHPNESYAEIVCWNPENFKIFARVARKVGRTKEARGLGDRQE